jgi:predicted nucleic acid-binding protein
VLAEYQAGIASGALHPDAWTNLSVLTLTEDESTFANALPPRLGTGERTCLAIAIHRQGLLVSDDRDARRIAQQHAVPTTGTVGILVRCIQRGDLSRDQANALLEEMRAFGYRSPVTNLDSLLGD